MEGGSWVQIGPPGPLWLGPRWRGVKTRTDDLAAVWKDQEAAEWNLKRAMSMSSAPVITPFFMLRISVRTLGPALN